MWLSCKKNELNVKMMVEFPVTGVFGREHISPLSTLSFIRVDFEVI